MLTRLKRFIADRLPALANLLRSGHRTYRRQQAKVRIRRLLAEQRTDLKLEVGSGDVAGTDGWLTIDMTRNCDIYWDLRKGLPFPGDSVSAIYSSHFFEHLSFSEGQAFLDECFRALAPSGTFSICVPNARIYIEAYVRSDPLDRDQFLGYEPAFNDTTPIDYINYVAYMDGHHKYMFDEDNLLHILQSKGFRNARLREFDSDLDLEDRDSLSIYAIAEK